MKILQFASGDLWAGAEVQLYYLTCELAKSEDIELLVVLLNEGQLANELRSQDINVVVFDESSLSSLAILRKLYKLVKEVKPDIMHTHRSKENVIGAIVALLTKTKSVRTAHGASEFTNNPFNLKRFVFAKLDKMAGCVIQHKIIAVSQELAAKLKRIYPASKVITIDNSINIEAVINKSNEPTDFYPDEDHFNVAFIGRFVPVKRVDIFYKIAKRVIELDTRQNIHFYMIGEGPLWQQMHDEINAAGYKNKIHLTGFVKNVAPYLKHMDLLLFTSDHEGLPMTLLEAIILNVLVMSRDLATIKQVLCDGQCGFILDSDDRTNFSDLIIEIRDNYSNLINKRQLAIENVKIKYTIQEKAQRYLDVYKTVVKV